MGATEAKEKNSAAADSMSFAEQQTEATDSISFTDTDGDRVSFELRLGTLSMELNGQVFQQKLRWVTASGSCQPSLFLSLYRCSCRCVSLSISVSASHLTVCNAPTLQSQQQIYLSVSLITV